MTAADRDPVTGCPHPEDTLCAVEPVGRGAASA